MKTQRLTAVCQFSPRVGDRMMHQNKGPIHHSFSAPWRRETFPNYFNHAPQGNKEPGGSPGCRHHHWWMFAECQWTKCEPEPNEIWWAILGLRAKTIPWRLKTNRKTLRFSRFCVAQNITRLEQRYRQGNKNLLQVSFVIDSEHVRSQYLIEFIPLEPAKVTGDCCHFVIPDQVLNSALRHTCKASDAYTKQTYKDGTMTKPDPSKTTQCFENSFLVAGALSAVVSKVTRLLWFPKWALSGY